MGRPRRLEGCDGPVLPASRLLLRQAGRAALRRRQGPARRHPGRGRSLPLPELVREGRLPLREGGPAVPGAWVGAGAAPRFPPRQVQGRRQVPLRASASPPSRRTFVPQPPGLRSISRPRQSRASGFFASVQGQRAFPEAAASRTGSEESLFGGGERRSCSPSMGRKEGAAAARAAALSRARWKAAAGSRLTFLSLRLQVPHANRCMATPAPFLLASLRILLFLPKIKPESTKRRSSV